MRIDELLPRWTSYVDAETGGRDPLGLSRVSGRITDFLLTGIITTTFRARYYTFYCWALWHIQQEEKPRKYQRFVDALRRREAAFALASLLVNDEATITGVRAAKQRIQSGRKDGVFDSDFRVLPSNPLGGYGQYYRGSLYELGLTQTERGMDFVTAGVAEELARSFHSALAPTPYLKQRLFAGKSIPEDDLKKSAQRLGIDAIRLALAAKEREHLTNLLFGFLKKGEEETDERALWRRWSLARTLHAVQSYEKARLSLNAAKREELELSLLFGPVYYGILIGGGGKTKPYKTLELLSTCRLYWRQFCLHQYLILALEKLLWSVLETVADDEDGLSLVEIAERLTAAPFFKALKQVVGSPCKTPQALLYALDVVQPPDAEACLVQQKRIGYEHPLSEEALLRPEPRDAAQQTALACCALATLYAKWRGLSAEDEAMRGVASNAGQEVWGGAVLPRLDVWLQPDATWKDWLETFLQEWIVRRHEIVRLEKKLSPDSGWLQITRHRVIKLRDYQPDTRSSRHDNVVSILRDLNLLERQETGQLHITSEGEQILDQVLSDERSTPAIASVVP